MNHWLELIERNPDHSAWYIERFRAMEAAGDDLGGEARLLHALVPPGSTVLDAGCGSGRTSGRLAAMGHRVVGVDLDPQLIAAAEADYPGPDYVVADLAELDLVAAGLPAEYDGIVSAGNVMAFLDPSTRRGVLERLAAHLAPDGRMAIGFGGDRGYAFDDFFADADAAGLSVHQRASSWDMLPFDDDSKFVVAILGRWAQRIVS